MRLQVEYFNSEELFRDTLQQFAKGGILVRVAVGDSNDPELYSRALLEIKTPAGYVELDAEVVQVIRGVGVALAFDNASPGLIALLKASERSPFHGDAARHRRLQNFAEGTAHDAQVPQPPEDDEDSDLFSLDV